MKYFLQVYIMAMIIFGSKNTLFYLIIAVVCPIYVAYLAFSGLWEAIQ